jgi:hypothetical protein
MAKTRRKKINGKAPLTRNSKLVLVKKGTEILRKGGRPKGKVTTDPFHGPAGEQALPLRQLPTGLREGPTR